MTKFSRKYGQYILAVMGVVLMLVFTIIPATKGNQDQQSAGTEVGRLNGKKVTRGSLVFASNDIQTLERLLQFMADTERSRAARSLPPYNPKYVPYIPEFLDSRDINTHWFLLLKEADRYGINTVNEEVSNYIAAIALDNNEWDAFFKGSGTNEGLLRQALRDLITIRRLADVSNYAAPLSLRDLEHFTQRQSWRIALDYVTLDARKDFQSAKAPSAEEIQKQYDLYKDVVRPLPGETPAEVNGHRYPFGYKYPDRVEIEFLKFPRATLRAMIKPTAEDYDAAHRTYTKHPEEFAENDLATPPTTGPGTASGPSTQQAEEQRYQKAMAKILDQQLGERADKALSRLADRAQSLLSEPWKNVQQTPEGYKEPVPATNWVSYQKVREAISNPRDFPGYQVEYRKIPLEGKDKLIDEEGIGKAILKTSTRTYAFADLATHVHELNPTVKDEYRRLLLQVGVEGPVVRDADGNVYLYRIISSEASHPAKLEEVRDQVVEHLKKLDTFNAYTKRATDIAQQTGNMPGRLLAIATDQKLTTGKQESFSRSQAERLITLKTAQPPISAPDFVNKVFGLIQENPSTQPASQPSGNGSTTLIDESTLSAYVVQIAESNPPSVSDYKALINDIQLVALYPQYQRLLAQNPEMLRLVNRRLIFQMKWLGLDAVAQRLNYIPAEPFKAP